MAAIGRRGERGGHCSERDREGGESAGSKRRLLVRRCFLFGLGWNGARSDRRGRVAEGWDGEIRDSEIERQFVVGDFLLPWRAISRKSSSKSRSSKID